MGATTVQALAIAASLLLPLAAWAECSQSFDIAADEIAGLPHQQTERFAQAGMGVQFRYFLPNGERNLSYIRFDMGYPLVDDALAEAVLGQVRQNIKTVANLNGVTLEGPATLEPYAAGPVNFTNDIFLGHKDDRVVVEFLGIGHDRNCLHEVRFTTVVLPEVGALDHARALYRDVLDALAPYVVDD